MSFTDEEGNNYRAHPCYDGKAWNDYAMIALEGYPQSKPVFIHTFVDLCGLPEGDAIGINSNGQKKWEAGLYAMVAHSFDPVDKEGDQPQQTEHPYRALHPSLPFAQRQTSNPLPGGR
jgi:hypothetical protein